MNSSPGAQWVSVRQSPGFAPSSVPTASGVAANLIQQQHRQQHLGDYTSSMSMSAPSHKAAFDHGSLYPSELSMGVGAGVGAGFGGVSGSPGHSSGGLGPIRRHRSATPSVGKYAEGIRRPFSAALSDHSSSAGAPAPVSQAPGGVRSYHPYAVPHGASQSAHSSPMGYTVPLGYEGAPGGPQRSTSSHSHSHTHSRSNSSSMPQDQTHSMSMLNGHFDAMDTTTDGGMASSSGATSAYQGMYRTDSPMRYPINSSSTDSAYSSNDPNAQTQAQNMYSSMMSDPSRPQYSPSSQSQQQSQQASSHSQSVDSNGYYSSMPMDVPPRQLTL